MHVIVQATEGWLQDQVRALCTDLGLAVQHIERSDLAKCWLPGWPDLVIIGHGYGSNAILYRELKGQTGSLTKAQRHVGYQIQAGGGNWDVWRPRDLLTGRIAAELTAISKLENKNMSGGTWNYQSWKIKEWAEYAPKFIEAIAESEHIIDWAEADDTARRREDGTGAEKDLYELWLKTFKEVFE